MNTLVERLRDDDCDFDMQHRELIACEIERLEKERDNWENACAHWEKEAIESQAREAKLREALRDREGWDELDEIPTDDTALKEYRKKVLLEAADELEDNPGRFYFDGVDELRRIAEE